MSLLLSEVKNKIATLTLNNPAKKNALSSGLLEELVKQLAVFSKQDIRVVIIRASMSETVWSAGHDISELSVGRDPLGYNDALEKALRAVKDFRFPIIAMVHGSVWGGACDLAISCDLVVADTTCSFAITPAKIGLPYNLSGVLQFSKRLGINIAKEMFFTANPISAHRAYEVGLVNRLVEPEELEKTTDDMADTICRRAPLSVSIVKEQMRILNSATPLSTEQVELINAKRKAVFESKDYKEGVDAFLNKRTPNFTGE